MAVVAVSVAFRGDSRQCEVLGSTKSDSSPRNLENENSNRECNLRRNPYAYEERHQQDPASTPWQHGASFMALVAGRAQCRSIIMPASVGSTTPCNYAITLEYLPRLCRGVETKPTNRRPPCPTPISKEMPTQAVPLKVPAKGAAKGRELRFGVYDSHP